MGCKSINFLMGGFHWVWKERSLVLWSVVVRAKWLDQVEDADVYEHWDVFEGLTSAGRLCEAEEIG